MKEEKYIVWPVCIGCGFEIDPEVVFLIDGKIYCIDCRERKLLNKGRTWKEKLNK
jgi:hypothetical protein